jgi:uncharacterized protein involved in exopolysaccharide biosynthesis
MDNELTDVQIKAIDLMMDGKKTLKDIATDCGVAYQTVRSWRIKPEFVKELAARRREATTEAQSRLMAKANYAADKLIGMMDDTKATRIQFQAAKAVLDMALASGFIEFEERLQVLEDALAERQV